jgi:hypothetical protein
MISSTFIHLPSNPLPFDAAIIIGKRPITFEEVYDWYLIQETILLSSY